MKHSTLDNIDDQDKAIKTNNEYVKVNYEFFKKPSDEDDFEPEIVEDILKDEPYEHKKVETTYVELTVQDAATIDNQIKKEINDFLQLASEFNKVDTAATKQKKSRLLRQIFQGSKGRA